VIENPNVIVATENNMTPEERKKILGRPAVDIYAPGSPTVKAQDKMNTAANKVADNVATVTGVKGLNTIGRTIAAPVINATSRIASDFGDINQNRERVKQSRASLSAPDTSKFSMGQPTFSERPIDATRKQTFGVPKIALAQAHDVQAIQDTRGRMVEEDKRRAATGQPSIGETNKTLMRDFDTFRGKNGMPQPAGMGNPGGQSQNIINGIRQSDGVVIAPNGMEILNGNPRNNLSESRIEENITPATDLRGFTIPGQFNKETLTYGNPSALDKSLIASRGVSDQGSRLGNQSAQLSLSRQQRMDALESRLLDDKTTPEEAAQIKAKLQILGVGGTDKDNTKSIFEQQTALYKAASESEDPEIQAALFEKADSLMSGNQGPDMSAVPKAKTIQMAIESDDMGTVERIWGTSSDEQKKSIFQRMPANIREMLLGLEK